MTFLWVALATAILDLFVTWRSQQSVDIVLYHVIALLSVFSLLDEQLRPLPALRPTLAGMVGAGLLLIFTALFGSGVVAAGAFPHFLGLLLATALLIAAFGCDQIGHFRKLGLILGLVSVADEQLRYFVLNSFHLKPSSAAVAGRMLTFLRI